MTRLTRHLYRLLTRFGWVGLVAGAFIAISTLYSAAQVTAPQVTKIEIGSPTSTTAILYITVDRAAWLKVNYGTSTGYGVVVPTEADSYIVYAGPGTQPVTFEKLQAATIYHYQITVQDPNNAALKSTTEDRTFTTTSSGGGSSGSGLVISKVKTDCDNDHCVVSYLTSFAAKVELRWDLNYHDTFEAYSQSAIEPGYLDGSRALLAGTHLKIPPDLTFNTTYYYRLHAVDSSGNEFTTGDFSFLTAFNESDHVFSTGQCFTESGEPVLIGGCSSDHLYCAPGGHLIQDCRMMCGYICPEKATCMASGNCFGDPLSKSSYQCNKSECYDPSGKFISPAVMNCYASWPKCTANTILKVRKDRACDLWLSCTTAIQTQPQAGQASEDLCLSLGACNQLGSDGRCKNYLPRGQCSNDPLRFCNTSTGCVAEGVCTQPTEEEPTINQADVTYQTPAEIGKIANLSGNVTAGLDWRSINGLPTIQGNLPWNMMSELGTATFMKNGDLEYYTPASTQHFTAYPLNVENPAVLTADFEDRNNSSNHILIVDPIPTSTNPVTYLQYSGVATDQFTAAAESYYSASVRLRSKTQQDYKLRLQFSYVVDKATNFSFRDITVTGTWQKFSLGPTNVLSGKSRFEVVCADTTSCGTFELDDMQIRPILQVNDNPYFIGSSCRLYPKADAPSCEYIDANAVQYRGWRGYCLEYDSITGTCLSWWPIDLIHGEENILTNEEAVGYTDRQPLYMCAEATTEPVTVITDQQHGEIEDGAFITASGAPDACTGSDNSARCENNSGNDIRGYNIKATDVDHVQIIYAPKAGDSGDRDWNAAIPATSTIYDNTKGSLGGDEKYYFDVYPSSGTETTRSATSTYFGTLKFVEQGDNGSNYTGAWPTGSKEHDWEVSSYAAYLPREEDGNDKDEIRWKRNCQREATNGTDANKFGARIWTDSNGKLSFVSFCVVDDSGGHVTPAFTVKVYLKPYCSVLAKVVEEDQNQAWVGRTAKNSTYGVYELNYKYGSDFAPFGGSVTPSNSNPNEWTTGQPLYVQSPDISQTQTIAPQSQSRAGQPYVCRGDACKAHCDQYSGTKSGQVCYNSSDCTDADNNAQGLCIGYGICAKYDPASKTFIPKSPRTTCLNSDPCNPSGLPGDAGQLCIGGYGIDKAPAQEYKDLQGFGDRNVDSPNFVQSRIQRLFANSWGLWNWNPVTSKYETYTSAGEGWTVPKEICWPEDTSYKTANWIASSTNPNRVKLYRPSFPGDYCAIPPTIVDDPANKDDGPVFSTGTKEAFISGSGDVLIKFNTNADPEQIPLKGLVIDWGNGEKSEPYVPGAPRTNTNNPIVVRKAYTYNSGNCPKDDVKYPGWCVYRIKIQLCDNWGWCNDASRDNDTDYKPDFDEVITSANEDVKQHLYKDGTTYWYDSGLVVLVKQ